MFKSFSKVFLLVVGALGLPGCSEESIPGKEFGTSMVHLAAIEDAYREFSLEKKRPPKARGEIEDRIPEELRDKVWSNPRDGSPYVIFWGVDLYTDPGSMVVVAHESESYQGERLVFNSMGVIAMQDDEFESAKFPENITRKSN